MDRAILHLVTAGETDLTPLLAELDGSLTVLRRDPDCFHGDSSPFTLALETTAAHLDALSDAAQRLAALIEPERSMAIAGADRVFIDPPEPSPVRYQYLMHRRSDFSHEEYLDRYESIHSEFGLRTPHIDGYTQLHVDLDASVELGAATGLSAPPCDSMSELHLRSVEHFVAGIVAHPDVGIEAAEDEERFVDRERSFGFTHRLV